MKTNILILLFGILTMLSCDKDNVQKGIDGKYSGTFQRGGDSSNVELTLSDLHIDKTKIKFITFNLYNSPTALPWGFRSYLPLGEVGIAFLQFRVGQNTKFRFWP